MKEHLEMAAKSIITCTHTTENENTFILAFISKLYCVARFGCSRHGGPSSYLLRPP